MKKAFGIIFILISLTVIGGGIVMLTQNHSSSQSFEGKFKNRFSQSHREQSTEQQVIGGAAIAGGAVVFVIGMFMVSTKSRSTRRKEAELKSIKQQQEFQRRQQELAKKQEAAEQTQPSISEEEKIAALKDYKELLDNGTITEEEFEKKKKELLG